MNQKISVLIVEDDRRLSYINRRALESEGYEARAAFTIAEARYMLAGMTPDVILLDVKLPDGSGFDLCREIRGAMNAHIIFLTSVTEAEGELEGLSAGGDDYLRKPYSIELLLRRVKNASQRKLGATPPRIVKAGALTLDIIAIQAYFEGRALMLSQKEFAILLLLVQNEGGTVGAEQIYESVWGQSMGPDASALHTAVYRLRKKLEPTGHDITTTRRKGYAFETL